MLAGAWFWGTISDRIGRKRGFTITIGIFAVFGFLSAFSPNMFWLCAFRILAGFGLGGAVPLDFSLFAEYLPTRNRGRWLVILESFWGVGTVVAAGLAWILVPTLGWRYLLGSSAVAGALVFWVRLRIPESRASWPPPAASTRPRRSSARSRARTAYRNATFRTSCRPPTRATRSRSSACSRASSPAPR